MSGRRGDERGVALLIALLALSFVSALAVGLALSASVHRGAASNYEDATELANISDSALELAARELALIADWDLVLAGTVVSSLVDGPPGPRTIAPGLTIDLEELTNDLTCGQAAPCSDAQVRAMSAERPWGANNPRWRPFLHMPFPALPAMPRAAAPAYIVVWIGDDGRETDDDPGRDGAGAGQEGRYVVRARAESFGHRGGRHAIEAELMRICTSVDGEEVCLPGIRVQSWRSVTAAGS